MALLFAPEARSSPDMEPANTSGSNPNIKPGHIVTREDGGGVHVCDPSTADAVDGIVLNTEYGDHIPEHDEAFGTVDELKNYTGDGTYAGSDLVPIQPIQKTDVIRAYTIADNGEDPAPSFDRNHVLGWAKLANQDTYGVVEDGYSDDEGNTYNDAGDWVALGYADRPEDADRDGFQDLPHIRVDLSA